MGRISVLRGVWTEFVDSAGASYSKMNSRLRHIQGITTFCVESDIQQGEQISLVFEEEDDKNKQMNFEDFPIDLSSDLFFESQWQQFERKDITFFSSHQRNRELNSLNRKVFNQRFLMFSMVFQFTKSFI